ncbi:hypothetical protein BVRB_4g089430 [Beta vulgaris subsp. vulgaris]|nr:hypothetical protein BVRB_4g089430 [Beta vulgaris subsp. vulgaris]
MDHLDKAGVVTMFAVSQPRHNHVVRLLVFLEKADNILNPLELV